VRETIRPGDGQPVKEAVIGVRGAPVSQTLTPQPLRYFRFIDGLRAIAVLAVIAFHFGGLIPHGYLGVDVFFVISGFLIHKQLMGLRETKNSFFTFFKRRALRVYPALSVAVVLTLVLGFAVQIPQDFVSTSTAALFALLGTSNLFFIFRGGDYFDTTLQENPLLHTWSLGIEEQWYLCAALLILLVLRRASPRVVLGVVALLSLVSFIAFCLSFDRATSYFNPAFRFWELGAGAVVAGLITLLPPVTSRLRARVLKWQSLAAGVVLVIGLGLVPFIDFAVLGGPVGHLLIVAAVSLIIFGEIRRGEGTSRFPHLLAVPPLAYIGKISYSLYLYHFPIWTFLVYRFGNDDIPAWVLIGGALFATFALAAVSYRFVERSFWSPRGTS
jgi:peptidoglycan/LPS O-acetylase OafA/YrhL